MKTTDLQKLFSKFSISPDVSTLAEMAEILHCQESVLMKLQKEVPSLAKGPPYNVSSVAMELLAGRHLSFEDIGQTNIENPSEAMVAIATQIVGSSLKQATIGEFLENLMEDSDLSRILLQGDVTSLNDAIRMAGGVRPKVWQPLQSHESLSIAISRPRSAALFFDRVWTIDRDIPGNIGFRIGSASEKLALGLLDALIEMIVKLEPNEEKVDELIDQLGAFFLSSEGEAEMTRVFLQILESSMVTGSSKPVQAYFAAEGNLRKTYDIGSTPMVIAALESLNWIDEEQLEWDQVREVREDAEAAIALKRMLHWLDTEMVGKPLSYIEDEILLRHAKYEEATKKHGIKLVNGAIGTLLDVKLWNAIVGTAVGAALAESYLVGIVTGISLQGLRVAYETINLHHSIKSELNTNPIAYVHRLKSKTMS